MDRQDLLSERPAETLLAPLKKSKGGRYKYQDNTDSIMFSVYTGIEFGQVSVDSRRGLVVELLLDAPPGSARHERPTQRAAYWSGTGKKRLMNGGLVALLWATEGKKVDVHIASIAITNERLAEGSKARKDRLPIKVQFFDATVNIKILDYLRLKDRPRGERILVESGVLYESVRFIRI